MSVIIYIKNVCSSCCLCCSRGVFFSQPVLSSFSLQVSLMVCLFFNYSKVFPSGLPPRPSNKTDFHFCTSLVIMEIILSCRVIEILKKKTIQQHSFPDLQLQLLSVQTAYESHLKLKVSTTITIIHIIHVCLHIFLQQVPLCCTRCCQSWADVFLYLHPLNRGFALSWRMHDVCITYACMHVHQ